MTRGLDGKVAFITGAARGQGRSHAIRLAQEGADIIAVDVCEQTASVAIPLGTQADLEHTVELVQALGRRAVAATADVRDFDAMNDVLATAVGQLGRLNVVVANAGISSAGRLEDLSEETWRDMIDVNLTGAWHTVKAAIPHLRSSGGGSIVMINSAAGLFGVPGIGHYVAAKHGMVGLMRTLALELAVDGIRVNSVHPSTVNTPMLQDRSVYALFAPDLSESERTQDRLAERFAQLHVLDVPWLEPEDVSHAVAFLASDEARYITGACLPVDAGAAIK